MELRSALGRRRAVLIGAVVVLAIGLVTGLVAAGDVLAIDANHPLTETESIAEYQESGSTSTSLVRVDMSVKVAKTAKAVGLDGLMYSDISTTYLRFEYREEVSRTIRIYIPDEYFRPRPKDGLEAAESNVMATLEPVANGSYTSVRVTFSGPTTAVFPLSKEAGIVFDGRATVRRVWSNRTGVEVPSIYNEGQWTYIDSSQLEANTTYAIDTGGKQLTLQYDQEPAANASSWMKVPDCGNSEAPVCRFTREGENKRVYLLSRSTETPAVRYKLGWHPLAGIRASIRDATSALGNLLDTIGGLFGG